MNYETVRNWSFEEQTCRFSERDTMIYALGLGLSNDPLDTRQLRFTTEKNLIAMPSFACVLGSPGFWLADERTGVNWVRTVHGEQDLELFAPLPTEGTLIARNSVTALNDKGMERGAMIEVQRQIETEEGKLLARIVQTIFMRDDGGFSADHPERNEKIAPKPPVDTGSPPEFQFTVETIPQIALIYRLSGDYAPLHSDPDIAKQAGFPRPFMHGLCTFGMATHAALNRLCDYRTERFRRISARFSAPAFPGETITFSFYRESDRRWGLQAHVKGRNVVVLDNGFVEISSDGAI